MKPKKIHASYFQQLQHTAVNVEEAIRIEQEDLRLEIPISEEENSDNNGDRNKTAQFTERKESSEQTSVQCFPAEKVGRRCSS